MTTSVLIVEDEPSILELISYTCRTSGMEVRKAANVAEAKKNLEAAKPDIILLDWMLPDCAGLDWLRELRSYHSNESLPVIMLTARGQEDDRVRGLEAGADDYDQTLLSEGAGRQNSCRHPPQRRRCAS